MTEPYKISKGEAAYLGPTSKWKRGTYRKAAEASPVKDENQTDEGNIREKQVRLKSEAIAKRKSKPARKR
jgi:hypothetical protein